MTSDGELKQLACATYPGVSPVMTPRHSPTEAPDAPTPALFPDPSATSYVVSVVPVRRPLSPDVAPDTRIRRLHLRKGAWWSWAPRHDPSDDHLYGWLRLDDETQQLLTSRLARLEVPSVITEKEVPPLPESQLAPAYDAVAGKVLNVVAAMRDLASIPASRRLFQHVERTEAEHAASRGPQGSLTSTSWCPIGSILRWSPMANSVSLLLGRGLRAGTSRIVIGDFIEARAGDAGLRAGIRRRSETELIRWAYTFQNPSLTTRCFASSVFCPKGGYRREAPRRGRPDHRSGGAASVGATIESASPLHVTDR